MPKISIRNMMVIEILIRRKKTDFFNNKLNMLAIHEQLSKLSLNNTQMDFVATSLYHSATWVRNSLYPKIETGFTFKPLLNDVYIEAFINQSFNQDGNESQLLRINFYNPPNLIFQYILIRRKFKKIEVNRMRDGFIIDTLTSVDIQAIVKIGGKVIEFYKGVHY